MYVYILENLWVRHTRRGRLQFYVKIKLRGREVVD
jgi:hypothetical protein